MGNRLEQLSTENIILVKEEVLKFIHSLVLSEHDRKLKVLRCKRFCSSHDLGLQTMLTKKNQTSKAKRSAVYKERRRVQSYSITIQ